MSKKIFGLKDLQHVHTFKDIPSKKKRCSFPAVVKSDASSSSTQSNSLVDPIWETIDPTPDLYALFQQYDATFFGGKLAACEVKWSSRMTSSAGLCSFERKDGFCSIRLSKPLLQYRPRKDLVETLLHEMIHALLDRDGHGPMFQFHMRRINMIAGTNISIYHNFHDEVSMRPPFYGWVKRSMNRAPSKNDFWWKEHQMTCGGSFIKVREPEGYGAKKKILEAPNGKSHSQINQNPTSHYFTGKGHVLGHLSSFSKKVCGAYLDMNRPENEVGTSEMKLERSPAKIRCTSDLTAEEDIIADSGVQRKTSENSKPTDREGLESTGNDIIICVPCPVCSVYVPENTINSHLDSCLTIH
uniref:Protein with SprT-like domain at the N terminus n=1 Tax=Setaria digitata TaxID=48799 RepID=A0A915PZB9_9BILA